MHLFLPLPSIYIYPFMQNNVHGYFCRNCSIFHMTIRINYQQYMSRMNKIAKNKLVCSIAKINIYVCLFRRSKIIESFMIWKNCFYSTSSNASVRSWISLVVLRKLYELHSDIYTTKAYKYQCIISWCISCSLSFVHSSEVNLIMKLCLVSSNNTFHHFSVLHQNGSNPE